MLVNIKYNKLKPAFIFRLAATGKNSDCLAQDVDELEGALSLHKQLAARDGQSVKNIIR